jgi:hypothetical protein
MDFGCLQAIENRAGNLTATNGQVIRETVNRVNDGIESNIGEFETVFNVRCIDIILGVEPWNSGKTEKIVGRLKEEDRPMLPTKINSQMAYFHYNNAIRVCKIEKLIGYCGLWTNLLKKCEYNKNFFTDETVNNLWESKLGSLGGRQRRTHKCPFCKEHVNWTQQHLRDHLSLFHDDYELCWNQENGRGDGRAEDEDYLFYQGIHKI